MNILDAGKMSLNKLSILIPCYNEEKTIGLVLKKFIGMEIPGIQKEINIVDDCSSDNTSATIKYFITGARECSLKIIQHEKNKGKGACIRSGLTQITGDAVIIQDSDLEYDPSEYHKLLARMLNGRADVVYGWRFHGSEAHRVLFFMHTIGNKLITFWSNLLTGLSLSDMETGYKMFRAHIIRKITIKENRFGFEPEITSKISRIKNIRIYEEGISYYGRGYDEARKSGEWTE